MADQVTARQFGVQFQGAINNLKSKLPEATLRWDDLAGPVHGPVFAIAGATNIDLVTDVHKSLVGALEKGTSITQFRKDFDAAVQQYGWTYKGKRGWRTSVIFNNNMRSAHMAGRWEQLWANRERRPYLQYRTAGDSRVRPQHRAWNSLTYEIGHIFWRTHYPPNGFGCRCTVRAYSWEDVKHLGIDTNKVFDMRTRRVVSKDGEITDEVPVGIDPGWDHNVGQAWLAPELSLGQKLANLPRYLQGPMTDKAVSPAFQKVLGTRFKAFRAAIKTETSSGALAQVVGFMDSRTITALADKVPELALQTTAVAALESAAKLGQAWPAEWIDDLPEHYRNYRAVLWDSKTSMLVVVPQANAEWATAGRTATLMIQPNIVTSAGLANSVVGFESAADVDLQSGRYRVLVGKLAGASGN